MVWLPNGEIFLQVCLVVLTEYTNITNRQTLHNGIHHAMCKHSIAWQQNTEYWDKDCSDSRRFRARCTELG